MSNGPIVDRFFDFFEEVVKKHGLEDKPEQVFDCDETGWSNKEKNRQKVYGVKRGHVFRQKVFTGDHITAHLCCSAAGNILPPMVIFKGGFPHREFQDGVPNSWLFGKSDTGYMDTVLFEEWFKRCFITNCGRNRPVLLLMDNHDSHISRGVVEAAIDSNIVLVGLPSHTTHIIQPLDVHFIGPLKEKLSSLAVSVGFGNQSMVIGKAKFPALLSQALDQMSASTVKESFRRAGIYPVNRMAIDRSQLVDLMFVANSQSADDTPPQQTCATCGQFVGRNPLVSRGLIPESMATVFLPPPSKPEKDKVTKRRVLTEGRVISSEEMLNCLKEKEENERKKKEAQELRQKEREMKKEKRLSEEKQQSKQKRQRRSTKAEEVEPSTSTFRPEDVADSTHSDDDDDDDDDDTVCCVCSEHQPLQLRLNTYIEFLHWGKCQKCTHWTHLKYCTPVKAIRHETVFLCPHCMDC